MSTHLADCAEPAEIMNEPIRQRATGQVILVPELAAVGVRVDASAGGELLDDIPHKRCRDARRVAVVQMLGDAAEREAGAEHGEDAVGNIGQAPAQPRRPVVGPAPVVVAGVVVDHGRRLRSHHGVAVVLDGAVRLLPLAHQRLRRLLRRRPHRCDSQILIPKNPAPTEKIRLSVYPKNGGFHNLATYTSESR